VKGEIKEIGCQITFAGIRKNDLTPSGHNRKATRAGDEPMARISVRLIGKLKKELTEKTLSVGYKKRRLNPYEIMEQFNVKMEELGYDFRIDLAEAKAWRYPGRAARPKQRQDNQHDEDREESSEPTEREPEPAARAGSSIPLFRFPKLENGGMLGKRVRELVLLVGKDAAKKTLLAMVEEVDRFG